MIGKVIKVAATAVFVATAVYAYREKKSHGVFYGIPFDYRVPTPERIRERLWNPDDPRVLTPMVFGAGWSINFYQAGVDMGLIEPPVGGDGHPSSQPSDQP